MLPFEEVKRKPEPLTESQVWGAAAPTPVEPRCQRCGGTGVEPGHPLWNCRRCKGAPAESQGVERAQPVEGPREQVLAVYPDAFAKHECGVVQGIPYSYWEIWVTPKDKWSSKTAGSGVTESLAWKNASYRLPAAPVEGVERVTDDAPARFEPTCTYCGKPGELSAKGNWYVHQSTFDYQRCGHFFALATQPAKHTDARPADTIPEGLRVDWSTLNEPYVTPVTLAWAIEREQNMQQFAKKVIERTGRAESSLLDAKELIQRMMKEQEAAETRIEVLEAALVRLRDCDWVISLPDRMDAVRDIARAALAAPSGEKEKV